MTEPHYCDEHCVCPIHETRLHYSPADDDHACQDRECIFGHGDFVQAMDAWMASLMIPVSGLTPFELRPPASACQHRPTAEFLRKYGGEWTCPEDGATFVLSKRSEERS